MAESPEYEVELSPPAPDRTASPLPSPVAHLAPPILTSTEGVAVTRLSLVPPEVARVLLVLSGVLATAAGFLPGWWAVGAAGASMLLAALCGVAAQVPRFLAPRLAVSATVGTLAGGGALLAADTAQSVAEGWPRALALLAATALSFLAGKPVGTR
jgi:hypothetical protein